MQHAVSRPVIGWMGGFFCSGGGWLNDLILRLNSYFCREGYLNVYSVFGKIAVSGKLIRNNSLSNETYPKQKKNTVLNAKFVILFRLMNDVDNDE